jgi:DNA-binding MarR family transcriptional regulator
MARKIEPTHLTLRMWLHARQIGDMLKMCLELGFMRYHITSEQYDVLATVKFSTGRVRMTDIADWLRRSPNSVSMLVERMVKARLVKRIRDKVDRRVVYVALTSKGESILEMANPVCWQTIVEILSPLSYEDRLTLLGLLETLDHKAFEYLNPGEDIEELSRKRDKAYAQFMKVLPNYVQSSSSSIKRQGGKKVPTV